MYHFRSHLSDGSMGRLTLPALVCVVSGGLLACRGSDADIESAASSTPATTVADVDTVTPTEVATTSTTPPTTEVAPPVASQEGLIEVLSFVASQAWSGGILPQADAACFDNAIADSDIAVRGAAERLIDGDPFLWYRLDEHVTRTIAEGYVDCVGALQHVRNAIAFGTINTSFQSKCISQAWSDSLDRETIVSSLVLGLTDLPPGVLDGMVEGTLTCLSDEQWWIDDIALEIEDWYGYSLEQSTCVATTYVEALGVEPAIRRRLLTISVLALPPEQLAILDPSTCGVELVLPEIAWGSEVGSCLANVQGDVFEPAVVPCDQAHDGEVVGVVDLGDVLTDWPGAGSIATAAEENCLELTRDVTAAYEGVGATWFWPSRDTWERGDRSARCIIGKLDGSVWTAPSGIGPPAARVVIELHSLTVGQCLYGEQLVDGDLGNGLLEVVDCSQPHHAEVFHVSKLEDPADSPWPGEDHPKNSALARCHPSFDAYVGRVWGESRLGFTYVYPFETEWEANERLILCYLWDRSGRMLTGSMAGSGQ